MTPARLIGIGMAALGALVLIGIVIGLSSYQSLFGVGWNSRTLSMAGFVGISGFALLVSGLRIMGNSGNG